MLPENVKKNKENWLNLVSNNSSSKKKRLLKGIDNPPVVKKTRKRYSNSQKMKFISEFECLEDGAKTFWLKEKKIDKSLMSRWKSSRKHISKDSKNFKYKNAKQSSSGIMKKSEGVFPEQQKKLVSKLLVRREQGYVVDGEYIQTRFKQILKEEKPPGWNLANASDGWKDNFVRRHDFTSQRKTNKKSKSIEERLPAILRFHQYTMYGMAYVLPSIYE
jgi:hypothetical protein